MWPILLERGQKTRTRLESWPVTCIKGRRFARLAVGQERNVYHQIIAQHPLANARAVKAPMPDGCAIYFMGRRGYEPLVQGE